MIAFKYTKTDGAEYISHLDLLRHIDRTLRRAGIKVEYSQGFHKHPRIFMGNPLALGVRSVSEYCAADTDFEGDFLSAFNACSPAGIKCLAAKKCENNPNYAENIYACRYEAEGIAPFDTEELMGKESIVITDLRGRTVDIRPRICSVERREGKVIFTLRCGEQNLRPDLFCTYLAENFGGRAAYILKTESYFKDGAADGIL